MFEEIVKYVKDWNILEGVKPENNEHFILHFIILLNTMENDSDISFQGEGSYFGKQVGIAIDQSFGWSRPLPELTFEIAYSNRQIVVYSGNHNGFWHPPYISLKEGEPLFIDLQKALYLRLSKAFGLPEPVYASA